MAQNDELFRHKTAKDLRNKLNNYTLLFCVMSCLGTKREKNYLLCLFDVDLMFCVMN